MRISRPKRELYKLQIKNHLILNPKSDNHELSKATGLHRNTITRLLDEIRIENESQIKALWKQLLLNLEETAKIRQTELNNLWVDAYSSNYFKNTSGLVEIVRENWKIEKDLLKFRLHFLGVQENHLSLIQINLGSLKKVSRTIDQETPPIYK